MLPKPALKVIKPGFLSLIQDLGRTGYQHLGISQGGPADEHAFLWANKLLGNNSNAACIEVHLGMLELEVMADTEIAICGADFNTTINDCPIENWSNHRVVKGDIIKFSAAKRGNCGYLAIAGGIQWPKTLGSRATVIRDALSPSSSRALLKDDALSISVQDTSAFRHRTVHPDYIPDYTAPLVLNLFPCYQWPLLTQKQRQQLLNTPYKVSNQSNRMGCRLDGDPLADLPCEQTSEGIALGSVQLPADGQPIILLQDRQTIGGYPKAGVISRLDCARLAQRKPNSIIHFRLADTSKIQEKEQQYMRFFEL